MSGAVVIPEGVPTQPWGEKPPPLPANATRKDADQIVTAWRFWRNLPPTYVKDGNDIVCSIDVKGRTWNGRAPITNPADHSTTAWNALHNCIEAWLDDTNVFRSIRRRFRG
jgi:hypothetical protein